MWYNQNLVFGFLLSHVECLRLTPVNSGWSYMISLALKLNRLSVDFLQYIVKIDFKKTGLKTEFRVNVYTDFLSKVKMYFSMSTKMTGLICEISHHGIIRSRGVYYIQNIVIFRYDIVSILYRYDTILYRYDTILYLLGIFRVFPKFCPNILVYS